MFAFWSLSSKAFILDDSFVGKVCPVLNAHRILANNRMCFLVLVTLSLCKDVDGVIVGRGKERRLLSVTYLHLEKEYDKSTGLSSWVPRYFTQHAQIAWTVNYRPQMQTLLENAY